MELQQQHKRGKVVRTKELLLGYAYTFEMCYACIKQITHNLFFFRSIYSFFAHIPCVQSTMPTSLNRTNWKNAILIIRSLWGAIFESGFFVSLFVIKHKLSVRCFQLWWKLKNKHVFFFRYTFYKLSSGFGYYNTHQEQQ